MRFHGSAEVAFVLNAVTLSLALFGAAGCTGGDGAPLGGPYGGTTVVPPPVDAATTSTAGKASRCKATGSAGDGGMAAAAEAADAGNGGDAEAPEGGATPTWKQVYGKYLQGCTGPGCHVEMTTTNGAYEWLKSQHYISGTSSNLVSPATSCLKWYGGNMPPCGGDDPQAVADMNAWVAAGALDN